MKSRSVIRRPRGLAWPAALGFLAVVASACTTPPPPVSSPLPIGELEATAIVQGALLEFENPDEGGGPITKYEVSINSGAEQTLGSDRVVAGLTAGNSYTFRVRACNAGGCALWSPKSNAIVPRPPVTAPAAMNAPVATPGDRSVSLGFEPPADGGSPIVVFEVSVNGGADTALPANRTVGGLTNGTQYTFRIRACNIAGCGEYSAASAPVVPRAVPAAPAVSVSVSGRTISWSWNTPADNGSAVTGFEVRLNGSVVQGGLATSFSRTFGYSETHTLSVAAVNAAGTGPASSRSARTVDAPPPPPSISLSRGGPGPIGGSYWYSVVLSNFSPGSSVRVTCHDSVDPGGFYSQTFTINGAGQASDSTLCYSADGPSHWVTGGGVTSNFVSW